MCTLFELNQKDAINFEKENFYDKTFTEKLSLVLKEFYTNSLFNTRDYNSNYSPIFCNYYQHLFDPYMIGPNNISSREYSTRLWKPWEDLSGLDKTKQVVNIMKNSMLKDNQFLSKNCEKPVNGIWKNDISWKYSFFQQYILTREIISNKVIILGFYQIETGIYKRYIIKDIKKVCKLLRKQTGDFSLLLGGMMSMLNIKLYNQKMNQKKLNTKLAALISDATQISTTNVHILMMLKILKPLIKNKSKVVPFVSTICTV